MIRFTPAVIRAAIAATAPLLAGFAPRAFAQGAPVAGPPAPDAVITRAPKPFTAPRGPLLAPAPVRLPANVAARVNGTDITYADIESKLRVWAGRPVIQQIVQITAIEQAAKKLGVTVTPTELAAELRTYKQQQVDSANQNGQMMTWRQIAERNGFSDAYVADTVRVTILARKGYEKFLQANVPSLATQVKVAHILIPTINLPTKEVQNPPALAQGEAAAKDAAAKLKIDTLLADIKAGKITFADAAKQNSADDASKQDGGELPWASLNNRVNDGSDRATFEAAASALQKPDDVTPTPIKLSAGYDIVKLVKRGVDATPAEQDAYRKMMLDQAMKNQQGMNRWLQDVIGGSKIDFNIAASDIGAKPAAIAAKPTVPESKAVTPATKPVK